MRIAPVARVAHINNNRQGHRGGYILNFVNIIDFNKALELERNGFKYVKQKINNDDVYAFIKTPELMNYLNSNFSSQEFFVDNVVRF